MDTLVLPDYSWRNYEYELIGQFLASGFDPENPPNVADLLERDNIPPQDPEAIRKVDRYAPAAAAGALISAQVVEGVGEEAQFIAIDRRPKLPSHSIFDTIGIDVRRSWAAASDGLLQDSSSRLGSYIHVFNKRTLSDPIPTERIVTGHHITSGGQLATEIGGFLGAVATVIADTKDKSKRFKISHSLVTVELGRAVVHMTTTDTATPRWMSLTKLQLVHSRAGSTIRDRDGKPLWQGGKRPADSVTPKLNCPIHTHGLLGGIVHASINEAFFREAL